MRIRSERAAAIVFALLRLAFCAYRAAGQSITIDEAYTYNRFLSGPWSGIYAQYDANNHVLYSILARLSVHCFGLSEFALRLPSLIAGFLLTLGIFEVLRLCARSVAVRWIALAALSLHPLLLDFSVAARGYGLALAFLVWAIFFAARRWFFASGSALGFALAANFTMAFPALGLFGAVLVLDAVSWKDRLRDFAVMLAPAGAIFLGICFGVLRTMETGLFYVGAPGLWTSVDGLVTASLLATRNSGLIGDEPVRHLFDFPILPALLIFILAIGSATFLKDRKERLRLLPMATLVLSAAAIIAAHQLAGVPYPADRTGLYLILLFALAWAIATDLHEKSQRVNLALAAILVLQFVTQLHTGYFALWPEGSRLKDAAAVLRKLSAGRAAGSVKVSTSWYHQAALEFYRERWKIVEWAPIARTETAPLAGYDFYVLKEEDPRKVTRAGIRILFRDPSTRLIVGMNWPAPMK